MNEHQNWENSYYNGRGLALNNWLEANYIKIKIEIKHTDIPSFPRSHAYIDLVLHDSRIEITNKIHNNSVPAINIDSDHRALSVKLSLPQADDLIPFFTPLRPLDYNKTNWKEFQKYINNDMSIEIPNNRNLLNTEIDKYLQDINLSIKSAIDKKIPTFKDSTDLYVNKKINKLHKVKSTLLSILNSEYRNPSPYAKLIIQDTKIKLKEIKIKIKQEFQKSVNKFWENKIKDIPCNSPQMFPQISRAFRQNSDLNIPNLFISNNKKSLINQAKINPQTLQTDVDGNLIITNESEKLDILCNSFASANVQNKDMGKPRLNDIIDDQYNKIMNKFNSETENKVTLLQSSDTNKADNPKWDKNFFSQTQPTQEKYLKILITKNHLVTMEFQILY